MFTCPNLNTPGWRINLGVILCNEFSILTAFYKIKKNSLNTFIMNYNNCRRKSQEGLNSQNHSEPPNLLAEAYH